MEKRIFHGAFFIGLVIQVLLGTNNLVADQDTNDRAKQTGKILATIPKKIRISTKDKSFKVTTGSQTHTVAKNDQSLTSQKTQQSESGLCKLDLEVNQVLQDLHARASKKSKTTDIFDTVFHQLAQENKELQQTTREHTHTFAQSEPKKKTQQPKQSELLLDAALDFLKGETKKDEVALGKRVAGIQPEIKKMVDVNGQTVFPSIPEFETSLDNKIVYDASPEHVVSEITSYEDNYRPMRVRPERKRIYLGRAYNYAVIEEEEEKHFVIPSSIFASFIFKAFDDCQRKVGFANFLLGGQVNFTVGDIFLESRLSARVVGAPEEDKSILFLEPGGPGNDVTTANGGPPQFGNRRRQQYLGLLAPVQVKLNADLYEIGAQSGLIYRFFLDCEQKTSAAAGFIIPVISLFQNVCIEFQNGKLYDRTEFSAKDATYREASIGRFFNDFSDLEDFFIRAVLIPKGITIEKRFNRTGLGDITVFGLVDVAAHFQYLDGMQFGINFTLPTSNKANGNILFEPELGEGGAFQIDLFTNAIFNSGNKYFNPAYWIAGNFAFPFTARKRVPKLVTHALVTSDPANPGAGLANEGNRVTNIPGLIAPVFREYFALAFSELDSLVPAFGDTVSTVRFRRGPRVDVGLGNYFYDVFSCNFRFGIFYDFMAQADDDVCPTECDPVKAAAFDTSAFRCINQYAHRIGFNLTYKFACGELNVGSQFVVAGKNTPKRNEAFASFIAVF